MGVYIYLDYQEEKDNEGKENVDGVVDEDGESMIGSSSEDVHDTIVIHTPTNATIKVNKVLFIVLSFLAFIYLF